MFTASNIDELENQLAWIALDWDPVEYNLQEGKIYSLKI